MERASRPTRAGEQYCTASLALTQIERLLAMAYKGKQQLGLFKQDTTSTIREDGIPVYRVSLVRESRLHCYHKQIRSSADASTLLHTYLADVDREHFVVLMLDQKNKIIGINTVSVGSLTASVVHSREVFKAAILCNAAGIMMSHIHASMAMQSSHAEH